MKKYFSLFYAVIMAAILLSSCLGSNDDNNSSDVSDTMISSFSLSSFLRTMHVTASDGSDSTYVASVMGTTIPFTIDHINGLIYNPDSLPRWSNPAKILCNISSYRSALIGYMKNNSDTLYAFNSRDTINFTSPLEFRVYAPDGSGVYRSYMVSVNIHQEKGDSMRWCKTTSNNELGMAKSKLYSKGESLYLMGTKEGKTVVYTSGISNGIEWNELTENVMLDEKAYNNTVIYGDEFFTLSNGTLYKSADAANWQTVSTPQIDNLVAAGSVEMYGIGEGKIKYSNDGGLTWQDDAMDDQASMLPVKDFSYAVKNVEGNAETERIIIIGNLQNDSINRNAMVWSKVVEKRKDSDKYSWIRVEHRTERVGLPYEENLCVTQYDGGLLSMKGSTFLISVDDGMVWNVSSDVYYRPNDFNTTASDLTMASDKENNLWFVTRSGDVWKARINRLAWKELEKSFK